MTFQTADDAGPPGQQRQSPVTSLAQFPDLLTVEEAAAVLRIGRASAYEMARAWRASGGREGLPVLSLGRSLRVPRAVLENMVALREADGADPDDQRAPARAQRVGGAA
ncbi:MAG TPA: helix-turn-helix domain-containing protein [Acidimicrobiales bacterium]|nr:helix-turn-helix domain-containing protein [Acidimicrobiales bacterium]